MITIAVVAAAVVLLAAVVAVAYRAVRDIHDVEPDTGEYE